MNEQINFRPKKLSEVIGRAEAKSLLDNMIHGAKLAGRQLDHVLFYGPPGIGKTTVARLIAQEVNQEFVQLSGALLLKGGDLLALLHKVNPGAVIFIDEIHRLSKPVEEMLYTIMEDGWVDIILPGRAKSTRIEVPPHTLIGATTKLGSLSKPFIDRFGAVIKLDFYPDHEIKNIIRHNVTQLDLEIAEDGLDVLAQSAHGTPRLAIMLVKRLWELSLIKQTLLIDLDLVRELQSLMGRDGSGFDLTHIKYLQCLYAEYDEAVGLNSISAMLGEDVATVENIIEPILLRNKLIIKTSRGRKLSAKGYNKYKDEFSTL